jgi:hypothetical protein
MVGVDEVERGVVTRCGSGGPSRNVEVMTGPRNECLNVARLDPDGKVGVDR